MCVVCLLSSPTEFVDSEAEDWQYNANAHVQNDTHNDDCVVVVASAHVFVSGPLALLRVKNRVLPVRFKAGESALLYDACNVLYMTMSSAYV